MGGILSSWEGIGGRQIQRDLFKLSWVCSNLEGFFKLGGICFKLGEFLFKLGRFCSNWDGFVQNEGN